MAGERAGPEVIRAGKLPVPLLSAELRRIEPIPWLDSTEELNIVHRDIGESTTKL